MTFLSRGWFWCVYSTIEEGGVAENMLSIPRNETREKKPQYDDFKEYLPNP